MIILPRQARDKHMGKHSKRDVRFLTGCIESREPASGWDVNYEGDIRLLAEYGFDGVKFDGCGSMCNMTEYAELMNETGKV